MTNARRYPNDCLPGRASVASGGSAKCRGRAFAETSGACGADHRASARYQGSLVIIEQMLCLYFLLNEEPPVVLTRPSDGLPT